MKIDFVSGDIAKRLARKLQRTVEARGDSLKYRDALTIVSRAFGHDDYNALHGRLGLAQLSLTDREADPEERGIRYKQYVTALSEKGFTVEEAQTVVDTVQCGPWWGFKADSFTPRQELHIRVADTTVEFLDLGVIERLRRVLKRSVKGSGVEVSVGPRHLMARMFGHETFDDMVRAAAKGDPTPPDFHVSPELLDHRVACYLLVLADAGFDMESSMAILQNGESGWLGIEKTEWEPLRQSRRADRLEHGWRPRWRPRRLQSHEDLPAERIKDSKSDPKVINATDRSAS